MPRLPLLCLLLAAAPLLQAQGAGRERPDHAERREEALLAWSGGRPDLAYLDFKARAAAKEVEAWRPSFTRAAAAGPVWRNLGPFHQTVLRISPDNDGGRVTALAVHPTNPQILFVATQSGLFRCANADPAASGDWVWESLADALPSSSAAGNLSIGAIALNPADPDTIYAGMGDPFGPDSRGFYASHDGGATWSAGVLLGNATRTLDILALDADILLVGTNAGLWRSTNGGLTFSNLVLGGSQLGNAWSIRALSATDLVCSRGSQIFWSADRGATWTAAALDASVTGLGPSRITVEVSPASATRVWGACNQGGNVARGLLKSGDKGHTWTFVPAPNQAGGLFQGSGWNGDPTNPGSPDMPYDGGQGTYNQGLAVDPVDPDRVFLGANLALYRTTNGGASWEQLTHWAGFTRVYSHADLHATAWSKAGPKTLFLGSDGGLGILRQPDRASVPSAPWDVRVASDPAFLDHRRNKGLATQLIYHLGSTPAATPVDARFRITAGLQDNGIIVRQDEGQGLAVSGFFPEAVQANGDSLAGDGFGTVIHAVNGDLMLGVEQFNFTFRSSNGGQTWALSQAGLPSPGDSALWPFLSRLVLGGADPTGNTVYTPGRTGVWKSTNFGQSWSALPMGGYNPAFIIRNLAASKSDPLSLCVVTGSNTGFVTGDGGATWTQFGTIPNSGSNLSSAWFDTLDAGTLYVASTALNATTNHLWKSSNRGATWTALDTASNGFPFGIPVQVVQNAPWDRAELLAGTDLGLYRSTDGGATWARYGAGLPLVGVRDLYMDPAGAFLRVATWGRGIWELGLGAAVLAVTPDAPEPDAAGTVQFAATLGGAAATVAWSVQEGAAGGTISAAGLYTAPAGAGTFHVIAMEAANPSNTVSRPVKVWRPADADANGGVDILDLARLARAFGTVTGQPLYDGGTDLDGDGLVGDADAGRLLARIQ